MPLGDGWQREHIWATPTSATRARPRKHSHRTDHCDDKNATKWSSSATGSAVRQSFVEWSDAGVFVPSCADQAMTCSTKYTTANGHTSRRRQGSQTRKSWNCTDRAHWTTEAGDESSNHRRPRVVKMMMKQVGWLALLSL